MWLFDGASGSCCSMTICRTPQQAISPKDAPTPVSKEGASTAGASPQSMKPLDTVSTMEPKEPAGGCKSPNLATSPKDLPQGPPLGLTKARSSDRLDTETCSIASSQKNSTRSGYSAASSIGSEFINDKIPAHQRDIARIQSQMKTFVKGMVRGREMNVLSVDGQLRTCTCSFDRKLRSYNIVINKDTRSIPLSKFKEVLQGTEPDDIATPLDELCATFVLDSGECLSFRFKDVRERESFAICLQIIVDGHQ
mmetsp:Transcript_31271/g.93111  ORF Transcript_31271/g.93111 Transcript_31271/m.93111 type:complete len:252 (+) Transcript_31271:136-891(+)